MLGYFVIFFILVIVIYNFTKDYYKGIYLCILFLVIMPSNSAISISIALPSFTIHRLILFVWLIFWLKNKEINKKLGPIPYIWILMGIAGALFISTLLSSNKLVSVKRLFYYILETILFYIILQTSMRNKIVMVNVIRTVTVALLIVALIGIMEKYTGFNPSPLLGRRLQYDFELQRTGLASDIVSTYLHRILFGISMALGMMYSLFQINKYNKKLANIILWTFFFINGVGLYFSLSRGPWLAFTVSVVLMMIIVPRDMLKKGLVLLLLVGIAFMLRPGTKSTIFSLARSTGDATSLKGSSFRWRFIVWKMAYTQITQSGSILNTLFGFGGGSSQFMEFGYVRLSDGHITMFESWDSEFAELLFEQGMIGFLCVLYFYFRLLLNAVPYCIKTKTDSTIMQLSLACLFIFIVMKTNVKIFAPQLVYLEYISISCIAVLSSKKYQDEISSS